MKRLMANLLAMAACLILCVGCSSVQPAQEPRAAAATPPAQKQAAAAHDYPMEWFVRIRLAGYV
jgi:predicted component of type VI protein secretion system